jgi:hypothetical protein
MTGGSGQPIGRRPRDYLDCLPDGQKMRVIDRIRRAYLHQFRAWGEDCAQEACARLLASASELRTAPQPTATPTSAWYDEAENALVRFATGAVMRRSVISDMYSEKGMEPLAERIDRGEAYAEGDETPPGAASRLVPHGAFDAHESVEDELHWTKVVVLLRKRLVDQPNLDPAVLQVFDQLARNVDASERCRSNEGGAAADIVRGESFQINHAPLLASLQRSYPDAGWDLRKLRLKIADLGRDASRVEQALADDGVVLFGTKRATKAFAEATKIELDESESQARDPDCADSNRGTVS